MTRKTRSDKTVGKIEKDLGLSTGAIRNKDGRDPGTVKHRLGGRVRRQPCRQAAKGKQGGIQWEANRQGSYQASGWRSMMSPISRATTWVRCRPLWWTCKKV